MDHKQINQLIEYHTAGLRNYRVQMSPDAISLEERTIAALEELKDVQEQLLHSGCIDIKLVGDIWMARNDDPFVRSLFGCDWIPTSFRSAMPGEEVISHLQQLNPECTICLIQE